MSERLQKYLARAGIASRRHAEELISAGRIKVNNQTVTELGTKVEPGKDLVAVDGKLVNLPESNSYHLLYKPAGVVTTLSDPQGRPTVASYVEQTGKRLFPVGRLDYDAEGALLFTDDGELAHKLTHPSFQVPRSYLAKVKGVPDQATLDKLRGGVRLEDGMAKPLSVDVHEAAEKNTWIRISVAEGRPHLIKRLFAAVGHPVVRLYRPSYASVNVQGMRPGELRELSAREVQLLQDVADGKVEAPVTMPGLPPRRHGRAAPGFEPAEGFDDEEVEEQPQARPARKAAGPRDGGWRAPARRGGGDEREARGEARPERAGRAQREERPERGGRAQREEWRPGGAREARPARPGAGRFERGEGGRGGERAGRFGRDAGERGGAGARFGREAGERGGAAGGRFGKPAGGRFARDASERGGPGGRGPRTERGGGAARFGRDEAAMSGRFGRSGPRSGGERGEGARGGFGRGERPEARGGFGRGERPEARGGFGRGERPEARGGFGRGERSEGRGGFGRGERPEGRGGFGRGERPEARGGSGRGERAGGPPRFERGGARGEGGAGFERGAGGPGRGPRTERGGERPARFGAGAGVGRGVGRAGAGEREERSPRGFGRGAERPARAGGPGRGAQREEWRPGGAGARGRPERRGEDTRPEGVKWREKKRPKDPMWSTERPRPGGRGPGGGRGPRGPGRGR